MTGAYGDRTYSRLNQDFKAVGDYLTRRERDIFYMELFNKDNKSSDII